MPAHLRSGLVGAGLFLATILVSVALGEIVVRALYPQKPHWLDVFAPHAVLPFTLRSNSEIVLPGANDNPPWRVKTDDDGFRVAPGAEAEDPRPRIAWIGDSFVFGLGLDYAELYPARVAAAPGARFAARSAGVPGYSPIEYRKTAEYLLGKAPRPARIVVSYYLGNDFIECEPGRELPVADGILGNNAGVLEKTVQRSQLAQLIERTIRAQALWGTPALFRAMFHPSAWRSGRLAVGQQCMRAELERLRDAAAAASVALDVVLIPDEAMVHAARGDAGFAPQDDLDYLTPHDIMVRLLSELGMNAIDLLSSLAAEEVSRTYLAHDIHLNARGNEIAAAAILSARPELTATASATRHSVPGNTDRGM